MVVVVWVDQRRWVARFVGISGWLRWVSWWWVWVLSPINLRPTPPIGVLVRGCAHSWILDTWLGNPWSSSTHPFCRPCSPTLCLFVIGDFLFCLWLVILFDLGWRKRLEIWVFFFFFFFAYYGLVVVVVVAVVMVVVVAEGWGGCGWCYGCFLSSGIYYFIVVVILFYCDVYIIYCVES